MARAPPLRMPFAPSKTLPIVAQSATRNAGIAPRAASHALISTAQVALRFIPIDRCAEFVAHPITDSPSGGDKWVKKMDWGWGVGNNGWGLANWPICGGEGTGFWHDGSPWHGVDSCDSNLLVTAL